MVAKVFWIVAIAFLVSAGIFGAWLGFSACSSHGLLVRVLGAILGAIAVVFTVFYAVACIVNFVYDLLRGFPRK